MLDLGLRNELLVLDLIRHAPDGTSQSEVVRRTGLSRQTVSLIVRRLLDRGIISTAGTVTVGRGKPATVLRLVPTAQLVAGVHLDPSAISLVIVDLLTSVVTERRLPAPSRDPEGDVDRIAAELTAVTQTLHEEGWRTPDGRDVDEALLGIGVASPGPIDVTRGVIVDPPWLPGWRDMPVVKRLRARTGLPVVLDKDTNAALTAEMWSTPQPTGETVLYLYIGAGIGSAVSVGGTVHHGAGALAGEIGHLPTGLEGAECSCGRRACLSLYTDGAALLERAEQLGVPLPDPDLPTVERLAGLTSLAADGDAGARQLVEDFGLALGEALRTLIDVHDPHRVIIGGPNWAALEPVALGRVLERSRHARLRRPREVEILTSQRGDDVGALGAATLFLQRELSPAARG
ncbi:ROK family transcriptional regulator [Brachybacterium sp. UMB0905]|uniref:ROK family transcriptional regulator n=1 Tax=Brachybacterium sp. UMB0905 TaxID=2069310 RepID=UPI00130472AC|nr:ROK family transcriptional regulator [Brachybacterium sp. UMB0905]